MSLLNHRLFAQRYFFPRAASVDDPTWVVVEGARLACWRRVVDPAAPTLVYFHGNGEVVADYVPRLAAQLLATGANLFLVEYRGYGASTGAPELGRMLDDVGPILEAVGAPPQRIVVFGRSVGSLFAIEAVDRNPDLAGLVLESGIADPYERLRLRVDPDEVGWSPDAFEAEVRTRMDHERVLGAYPGPTLILHARHDHLVGVRHAELNHEWARNSELVVFERGDHNSIFVWNRSEYLEAVRRFVARVP